MVGKVIESPLTGRFFVNLGLSAVVGVAALCWHAHGWETRSSSPTEERRLRGES